MGGPFIYRYDPQRRAYRGVEGEIMLAKQLRSVPPQSQLCSCKVHISLQVALNTSIAPSQLKSDTYPLHHSSLKAKCQQGLVGLSGPGRRRSLSLLTQQRMLKAKM